VREKVASRLKVGVTSRHRMRAAFTVNLLGQINCQESRKALLEALPLTGECPFSLRVMGAEALARLGCVEAVPFVYGYPWFGMADAYYFQHDLRWVRGACPTFRAALGDYAFARVDAASGTAEHVRAVTVLAHVGDGRLVAHLEGRLAANGSLEPYENHSLIAVGSEQAARVFAASVRTAAAALSHLGYEDGGRARLHVHMSVSPNSADLRYLLTPPFEAELEQLIGEADTEVAGIAIGLGKTTRSLRLLHRTLLALAERPGLRSLSTDRVADVVDPPTWMTWWGAAGSDAIRGMLLKAMSPVPSVEIEQVLIDCLDRPQFRWDAASHLGRMGSQRAAGPLRRLLEEGLRGWEAFEVARAIGELADPEAVSILAQMATEDHDADLSIIATSLGAIGTAEAERALVRLLDAGVEADWPVGGLFLHGSRSAVARVVAEAGKEGRGPHWLARMMQHAFFWRGHTVGRYYTHIHDDELIAFLEANEQAFQGKEKWDLIHAVEQVDSENVRRLLRLLASRSGKPEDAVVREKDGLRASALAYWELLYRGDSVAVGHFVGEAISTDRRRAWVARQLGRLPQDEVANHLRLAHGRPSGDEERAAIVRLVGFFGLPGDADLIRPFVDSGDDRLANAAYEALCRLTDPLLVPSRWSSL
jgi:hypothetical protein